MPALCAVGMGKAAKCFVDAVNRHRLPADSTEQAYASWMNGWVAHHVGNEELCVHSRQYAVAVYVDGRQYAAAREVGQFPHPSDRVCWRIRHRVTSDAPDTSSSRVRGSRRPDVPSPFGLRDRHPSRTAAEADNHRGRLSTGSSGGQP